MTKNYCKNLLCILENFAKILLLIILDISKILLSIGFLSNFMGLKINEHSGGRIETY